MLFAEAWGRYWRSWRTLVAANLCANLLSSVLFVSMAGGLLAPLTANPGVLPTLQQAGLGMLLAWLVVLIVGTSFLQGGVVGTVASVWRDPETPWTAFWGEGWHNWWRIIKVSLCLGVGLLLPIGILWAAALAIVTIISQLLSLPMYLTAVVGVVLAVLALLPVTAAMQYGVYAAVADGEGGRYAFREGWRCLTAGYADCFTAALVLIIISAVIAIVALPLVLLLTAAQLPPLMSQALVVVLESIIAPTFISLYMATRYETNQRAGA